MGAAISTSCPVSLDEIDHELAVLSKSSSLRPTLTRALSPNEVCLWPIEDVETSHRINPLNGRMRAWRFSRWHRRHLTLTGL